MPAFAMADVVPDLMLILIITVAYTRGRIPGMLGQYIIAIPEKNAILVRLGHKKDEERIQETTRDVYRYMDIGTKILDSRK